MGIYIFIVRIPGIIFWMSVFGSKRLTVIINEYWDDKWDGDLSWMTSLE